MERWQNKVAVVTGASSGIGAACCKLLVARGMIVVGLARRQERLDQLKATLPKEQQMRFHPALCDVSSEEDIVRTFAWIESKLGGVAVLVNNAGITRPSNLTAGGNSADLRAVLDTNVLGPAFCTREAFHSMKQRGIDGHVVLVNSIGGHKVPVVPGISFNMYTPSKFAVTAMTEVLRQEFLMAETKIKVTSISPGMVDTEMVPKEFGANLPSLRPEDVADAIAYCIQTPPNVQIHELTIRPVGEMM